MKKYIHIFLYISLVGCTGEQSLEIMKESVKPAPAEIVIDINTTRNPCNTLGFTGMKTRNSDPFTEIRETESSESVVLPELMPHIWIGNLLTGSSVADCNYKPLIYPRTPINITLTLPGTDSKKIVAPSFSTFMQYIQEQTSKGTFSQNSEFNFTKEQFSSYNELKVAFGSNVNTQVLFWGSQSGTQKEDQFITKATGLYIKFYQTSFKAIMDYPIGQIASIPENLVDSAVYINSISFGRLGIMTLETNSAVQYSKETVNRTFNKLFSSGSSSLTVEEKDFLNGCDFKIYFIGGNSSTVVESFTGYDGFIQHIKKGVFSKNEPGVPLFCTFNNVKDNSPFKIRFKYNIKREPLYVELVHKPKPNMDSRIKGYGDLYLYFYKNQAKMPTIADPSISFKIESEYIYADRRPGTPVSKTTSNVILNNSGYQTFIPIKFNIWTYQDKPLSITGPPWDKEYDYGYHKQWSYHLVNSDNFVIMGLNPIDKSNTFN